MKLALPLEAFDCSGCAGNFILVSALPRLLRCSSRSIRRHLAQGEYEAFETCETKGNGEIIKVVRTTDLPLDAQEQLRRDRAAGGQEGGEVGGEGEAWAGEICDGADCTAVTSPFPLENKKPPERPLTADGYIDVALAEARGEQENLARWNHNVLWAQRIQVLVDDAAHGQKQEAWRRGAKGAGWSVPTARRKLRILDEEGEVGLYPSPSPRRGKSSAISEDLGRKLTEFFLGNRRPTAAQAQRHVAKSHCNERGEQPPSLRTVQRFLRENVLPLEETAFRLGSKAYRALMEPKVTRELPGVNEIWCADHRLLDIMVLDNDRPVRPWVTAVCDCGSAAWVGYRLCRQPSSDTVCHALRSALLKFGVPQAFCRDNGREFVAKRLGGKALRLQKPGAADVEGQARWPAAMPGEVESSAVWQQLGVQLITTIPYSAWSKPIESFFGAFSKLFENLIPGWTGRDAKNKPEKLAVDIKRGRLLTWDQFESVFATLLDRWHLEHVCGDRACPPLAYYKDYVARIPDAQTLSFLLQQRQEARVRNGAIELRGEKYSSEELAIYSGCMVNVAWDPGDPSKIIVYAPHGRVLSVPQEPKAQWLRFTEANESVKRAARAQREHLQTRQAEIAGSCSLAELDPTGAVRLVKQRLELEAQIRREALALPTADAAAQDQAEAREEAEEVATLPPRRNIYREINEKTEARWRAIEGQVQGREAEKTAEGTPPHRPRSRVVGEFIGLFYDQRYEEAEALRAEYPEWLDELAAEYNSFRQGVPRPGGDVGGTYEEHLEKDKEPEGAAEDGEEFERRDWAGWA